MSETPERTGVVVKEQGGSAAQVHGWVVEHSDTHKLVRLLPKKVREAFAAEFPDIPNGWYPALAVEKVDYVHIHHDIVEGEVGGDPEQSPRLSQMYQNFCSILDKIEIDYKQIGIDAGIKNKKGEVSDYYCLALSEVSNYIHYRMHLSFILGYGEYWQMRNPIAAKPGQPAWLEYRFHAGVGDDSALEKAKKANQALQRGGMYDHTGIEPVPRDEIQVNRQRDPMLREARRHA